jgi:hypothetical protein
MMIMRPRRPGRSRLTSGLRIRDKFVRFEMGA